MKTIIRTNSMPMSKPTMELDIIFNSQMTVRPPSTHSILGTVQLWSSTRTFSAWLASDSWEFSQPYSD